MTTSRYGLAALMLVLSACSPAAEKPAETAGVDIPTPRSPFFGAWHMTGSVVAPWWDHKGDEPKPDPAMSSFMFEANTSTGAPIVTCDKPRYTTNIMPARALFQGNLPDPPKDAPALGFTDPDITVMSFDCQSSADDVSLDFPMLDENTIMLGLDNILYTFKRAP